MTAPRSLRRWLDTLDSDDLEQLLSMRPDALRGAPLLDLDDLALRLAHPASVTAAVMQLPRPALQALEVLTALGSGSTFERMAGLLRSGPDPTQHVLDAQRWLEVLWDMGLAWPGEDRVELNPGVHEVLVGPLALGRPVARIIEPISARNLERVLRVWGREAPGRKADVVAAIGSFLADPGNIRRLVATAPERVLELLTEHADAALRRAQADDGEPSPFDRGPESMRAFREEAEMVRWAYEHGLAFSAYGDHAGYLPDQEFPTEVLLALAPPTYCAPFDPDPPAVPTTAVAPEQAENAAAAAVTATLATTMAVLEGLARTPVAALKSGGVGTREVTRVAKQLGVQAADVRLALELAAEIELLAVGEDGRVGVSDAFGSWRRRGPAERAADLLQAWFPLTLAPTLDRDEHGRAVPALTSFGEYHEMPTAVLLCSLLAELDEEVGIVSPADLMAQVDWLRPIVRSRPGSRECTWDEANRLGVISHGRLTGLGRALREEGRGEVVEVLRRMVPPEGGGVLFGSDLTIMVPGSPDAETVDLLDAVGRREGHGVAGTWRVSADSVRSALDAGYAVEHLLEDLREVAGKALPQALEYLVRDVGRRHGHLGVQHAAAVVVSDDEALLAEVEVARALRGLHLTRVAPTVLVARAPVAEVLTALRAAGYLPVERADGGAPVVQVRERRGTRTREAATLDPPGAAVEPGLPSDAEFDLEVAEVMRLAYQESAADAAVRLVSGVAPDVPVHLVELEDRIAAFARRLGRDEVRHLADAVAQGRPVIIRYRSSSGGVSTRMLSDLEVGHGYLRGYCHLREDERTFRLDQILSVMAAV